VHVLAYVSLLRHVSRAGVDADAHTDRTRSERSERLAGRVERTHRHREGDEERVALRIDLDG